MAFQIPGSIISAIDRAKAEANAAREALTPKYSQMLDDIKSGAIFKDTKTQLDAIASTGVSEDTMKSITAAVDKAKSSMSIDMAVANAGLAQAAKEAAANGEPLSDAAKEAATAPMSVLKSLKSAVSSTVNSITSAISSVGSKLGITGAVSGATGITASMGAINAIKNSIPAATITDPLSGLVVTNPAYTEFMADPANAEKAAAINSITAASSGASASLASALSAAATAATSSKSNILSTLKADAFLAKLTKPMPADMTSIVSSNIDTTKLDLGNAIKAQQNSSFSAAVSLSAGMLAGALAAKKSSVLDALSTTMAAKTYPVVDNSKIIWKYEVAAYDAESELMQARVLNVYGASLSDSADIKENKSLAWSDNLILQYFGQAALDLRIQSRSIQSSKPEDSSRTDEEKEIVKASKSNGDSMRQISPEYKEYKALLTTANTMAKTYARIYKMWINQGSRFDLEPEVVDKLSKYTPSSADIIKAETATYPKSV